MPTDPARCRLTQTLALSEAATSLVQRIDNVVHEISEEKLTLEARLYMKMMSFNDFTQRRNTPTFPAVRPDRLDLNLEEQVFSQCTQRKKKRVCVKGGSGEKDRYDAAEIMRYTHADSDGEDLDEEDIEDDEEDFDDDMKKAGRKTSSQRTQCEWRVRCQYNKKSDGYKRTTLNLKHTCLGHLHKWRGPTSKAQWLAQVFGDRITSEYRRPVGQLQIEFRRQYTRDVEYMPMFRMRSICQDNISGCQQ
ncbi:hypothetical protein R1sor_019989 [Riccia sorocarpa]|uniref:Uncharacterized protein n=1 Tax=Riccia sorocarpa TaxID=122646 RepID=A0ABD3III2_9MARC